MSDKIKCTGQCHFFSNLLVVTEKNMNLKKGEGWEQHGHSAEEQPTRDNSSISLFIRMLQTVH